MSRFRSLEFLATTNLFIGLRHLIVQTSLEKTLKGTNGLAYLTTASSPAKQGLTAVGTKSNSSSSGSSSCNDWKSTLYRSIPPMPPNPRTNWEPSWDLSVMISWRPSHKTFFSLFSHFFPALQWVETNRSNFRIYPTDIRLSLPRGTTLKALIQMLRMLNMDVCRC